MSFKLRCLNLFNQFLGPLGLILTPKIYLWRTWSTQRKDVLDQLAITKAFDIGACTSQWYKEFRNNGFTAPVTSFECDPRALSILNELAKDDANWNIIPFALSDFSGNSSFHLWSLDSGQSSLNNASSSGRYFETINSADIEQTTVVARRLDEIITPSSLEGHQCLLKIDVQGAEMGVLRGAGQLLDKFIAIEIELALCDFYEKSEMVEDVLVFLRNRGFDPFTIQTERWGGNNGTLAGGLDCDVLLVNRNLLGKYYSPNNVHA